MEGIIVGIPSKHSQCWTISWNHNKIKMFRILHTKVMTCNRTMKKLLNQAIKKFNLLHHAMMALKRTKKHDVQGQVMMLGKRQKTIITKVKSY